jgi:hypothetical protein
VRVRISAGEALEDQRRTNGGGLERHAL